MHMWAHSSCLSLVQLVFNRSNRLVFTKKPVFLLAILVPRTPPSVHCDYICIAPAVVIFASALHDALTWKLSYIIYNSQWILTGPCNCSLLGARNLETYGNVIGLYNQAQTVGTWRPGVRFSGPASQISMLVNTSEQRRLASKRMAIKQEQKKGAHPWQSTQCIAQHRHCFRAHRQKGCAHQKSGTILFGLGPSRYKTLPESCPISGTHILVSCCCLAHTLLSRAKRKSRHPHERGSTAKFPMWLPTKHALDILPCSLDSLLHAPCRPSVVLGT